MSYQSENRICQNCKKDFTIEPDDFGFYEKIKVPPPTFCPECRVIRRMLHRNEHTLYKRLCDKTGVPLISIFSKENNVRVYDQKYWESDVFKAEEYNIDLDCSKTFFEQWKELLKLVPFPSVVLQVCFDSPFNHYCTDLNNCYYCFRTHRSKNVLYSYNSRELMECSDCFDVNKSNYLYECVDVHNSELSMYIERGDHISRSYFLYNCRNCVDCFMSSNLSGKQYYFRNKKLTRDEYIESIKSIEIDSYEVIQKLTDEFYLMKEKTLQKGSMNINIINSSGLYLRECKNVKNSFYARLCENTRYGYYSNRFQDSYDIYAGSGNEMTYETAGVGHNSNVFFSSQTTESFNAFYSTYCDYCKNIFGCIGLQNKEYCILNKQYTKEEYEELVPKIIKHMNDMPYIDAKGRVYKYGEFFPPELSPFAYNETIAQDYFPLTKEEILSKGYRWIDPVDHIHEPTLLAKEVPDKIQNISESICDEIIQCEDFTKNEHIYGCNLHCSSAFRITKLEFDLYKKLNIPIPHKCPQCRFYRRLKTRSSLTIFNRNCMCDKENHNHKGKCEVEFETSFAPDSPEVVYCEDCYKKEIY